MPSWDLIKLGTEKEKWIEFLSNVETRFHLFIKLSVEDICLGSIRLCVCYVFIVNTVIYCQGGKYLYSMGLLSYGIKERQNVFALEPQAKKILVR